MEGLSGKLDKLADRNWNLNELDALSNDVGAANCEFSDVCLIVDQLSSVQMVTDIRVTGLFMAMFRTAFKKLKLKDKVRVVEYLYQNHGAPLWHKTDDEMEGNMTTAINKINAQIKSQEYIHQLANEFSWYFMLSLRYTWWQLLLAALRTPAIVPILVEMLRMLPPVTAMRLAKTDPRVILVGVNCLVNENQLTNEEQEQNWIRLVGALMSTQSWITAKIKKSILSPPVVEPTEGIAVLVLPLLDSKPKLATTALLTLLDGDSETHIKWFSDATPIKERDGIDAPTVFSAVIDLFVKSRKGGTDEDASLAKLSLETLQLLSAIWKMEKVYFSAKEIHQFGVQFEAMPWTVRGKLFEYLRHLSKEPICVPISRCLFDTFQLPQASYRPVDCGHKSEEPPDLVCALTGLFRTASVCVESVEAILLEAELKALVGVLWSDKLSEPIMEAFIRVLTDAESLQEWRNCADTYTVLFDYLKIYDETVVTEAFSNAMRLVAPAGKLCDAVGRMILLDPSKSAIHIRNFAIIANEIVGEHIQHLKDPMARYFAWESLLIHCIQLLSVLSTKFNEVDTLLMAVANNLAEDKTKAYFDLIVMAGNSIRGEMREMLMKKLGIRVVGVGE